MVDTYGRWIYFSDEPEEKWCDLDRIAHYIEDKGYNPKTSIENMAIMLALNFGGYLESEDKDWPEPDCLIEEISLYVECSGMLEDFDYDP